jgi:outer membrane lipoprotein carrier protein
MILRGVLILLFTVQGFAKTQKPQQDFSAINQATKSFRDAKMIELDIEKKVIQDLLGTEKTYVGKVFYSEGLFKLETSAPEKTFILFDGRWIWNVKYFDPEISPLPQVARAKVDKKTESQIVLASLISNKPISNSFEIKSVTVKGPITIVVLNPKKKMEVKELKVSIKSESNEIESVNYKDDLNNETDIKIIASKFKKEKNTKVFKFSPPKGVQVINL